MPKKSYQQDEIDHYLNKGMSEKERLQFEEALREDPLLQEELALHQDILKSMDVYFGRELKARLQEAEQELRSNKVGENSPSRRLFLWAGAIAASLLIMLLAGHFITSRKTDLEKLYLSYYQPYPNIVDPIKRSQEAEEKGTDAIRAYRLYEKSHYKEAAVAFEKALISARRKEVSALKFYLALVS